MPNIKAGGKVFRNVEKLDGNGLHEVRVALIQEQQRITAKARSLAGTFGGYQAIGKIEEQMKQFDKRIAIVDSFAKQLIKKAIPEMPKHYLEQEPPVHE